MTDEEKAEEYLKKNKISNNEKWEVGGKYCYTLCKQAYLDGLAEDRKGKEKLREYAKFLQDTYCGIDRELAEIKKENEELKKQIEKMKCCGNCKHHQNNEIVRVGNNVLCRKEKNQTLKEPCLKWELAE